MGPRPVGRGNLASAVRLSIFTKLQWGHALSDVETRRLWKMLLIQFQLQWGHVLSYVETVTPSNMMGIFKNRFNGATSCRTWKLGADWAKLLIAQELQWGHVLSDVETRGYLLNGIVVLQLQWGHVLSDVETRLLLSYVFLHPFLHWAHSLSPLETPPN